MANALAGSEYIASMLASRQQSASSSSDASPPPPIVLVLCGPCGAGKSSTINGLLGHDDFVSRRSAVAVTAECRMATMESGGRRVCIVDTPGITDAERSQNDLIAEINRGVAAAVEEVGTECVIAVVMVCSIASRLDESVLAAFRSLGRVFGHQVFKHALLVFTHADLLSNTLEEYLLEVGPVVETFLAQVRGGTVAIVNPPADAAEARAQLIARAELIAGTPHSLQPPRPHRKVARRERQRALLECERSTRAAEREQQWGTVGGLFWSLASCVAPTFVQTYTSRADDHSDDGHELQERANEVV